MGSDADQERTHKHSSARTPRVILEHAVFVSEAALQLHAGERGICHTKRRSTSTGAPAVRCDPSLVPKPRLAVFNTCII